MAVAAAEERSVVHRFLRQLAAELDKVADHQNIEQAGGNLGLSDSRCFLDIRFEDIQCWQPVAGDCVEPAIAPDRSVPDWDSVYSYPRSTDRW